MGSTTSDEPRSSLYWRDRYQALWSENERLRAEIESGWLALGFRRNPQHDVYIADGINRLREMHAERMEASDVAPR